MAGKLNVPNVIGLNLENTSAGEVTFLQACQDSFNILDKNVLYKDAVTVNIPQPTIRAVSAQGHAFSVEGIIVASGDDYAAMRNDLIALLRDNLALRAAVEQLVDQIKGN